MTVTGDQEAAGDAGGHGEHGEHGASTGEAPGIDREQLVLAVKIAVGFVAGFIALGVVGPIVLAVIIGLATGH